MGAAMVAVLRLPLSAVVLATLLTAQTGGGAEPLIILGVVAAFLTTHALSRGAPAAPAADDAAPARRRRRSSRRAEQPRRELGERASRRRADQQRVPLVRRAASSRARAHTCSTRTAATAAPGSRVAPSSSSVSAGMTGARRAPLGRPLPRGGIEPELSSGSVTRPAASPRWRTPQPALGASRRTNTISRTRIAPPASIRSSAPTSCPSNSAPDRTVHESCADARATGAGHPAGRRARRRLPPKG